MAVAGFQNVSPSLGESKRASSLLKMWREIEAEYVESRSYGPKLQRNGSDSDCLSTCTSLGNGSENGDGFSHVANESENQSFNGSEIDHDEDTQSTISGQSSDLGESERERVRQVFREWMNTGTSKGHLSYGVRLNNRSEQWLGENECGTVRVIREWAHMTAQQKSNSDGVSNQIEHVRDGLVISHPMVGVRRPIRRFCGRQTLLDLLEKARNERKRELFSLSEQKPVANFAHRNRIQAFLRGWFLRNGRTVLDKRPSSVAATELVMLRQRHTVSDLREGFLSKLDSSASTSVNNADSDPSFCDGNNGKLNSTSAEGEFTEIRTSLDLVNGAEINRSTQEIGVQVTEAEQEVLSKEQVTESEQEVSFDWQSSRHGEYINVNITNDESSPESVNIYDSQSDEVHNENHESGSGGSDCSSNLERNANEYFVLLDNHVEEQEQMRDSHDWTSPDLHMAIDNWLDMPSGEVGTSVRRLDTFYLHHDEDDDDVHCIELRELLSRRRVSSLLGSSFRERLNQVLQSHVERLVHASDDDDWEMDDISFPPLVEQNLDQLNGDQTLAPPDSPEINPFVPPSSNRFDFSHPLWDEDFPGDNWPLYNSNSQLGTEWGMINELRLDMARLQERMNDIQSMMEACFDMQIELQRSMHQEVSAALNRSVYSSETTLNNRLHDESQWEHVRKGICCLCQNSKIDSLLYRCGHMCTCTKCAENLVQFKGKCPMCRMPAVEVVRAYFIIQ